MSFGIVDAVRNKLLLKSPSTETLVDRLDKYPQLSKEEIITRYLEKMPDASAAVEPIMKVTPITVRGMSSVLPENGRLSVEKRQVGQQPQTPRQFFDEIAVYLRIRPLDFTHDTARSELQYEIEPPGEAQSTDKEWTLKVHVGYTTRIYRFAKIFDPSTTNESLNFSLWPIVHAKLQNERDVSIMCYGPTGSGKTHTMEALFPFIFHGLYEEYAGSATFEISAIQIYCDKAYNLLSSTSSVRTSKTGLGKPFTSSEIDQRKIPSVEIRSYFEGIKIIENVQKRRVQRCNFLNDKSSRSHTMIFLYMTTNDRKRQISFIDLAGSERVKRTGSIGQAFDEGVSINKSLSSLFGLFSTIQRDTASSHDKQHVPSRSYLFRGNLLTRYLYSMKNSFFLLIANMSSESSSLHEAKNALDFAALSRKVGIASRQVKLNEKFELSCQRNHLNFHPSLEIFTLFSALEIAQHCEKEESQEEEAIINEVEDCHWQNQREHSDEIPETPVIESENRYILERSCIADIHPLYLLTQENGKHRDFILASMHIFDQTSSERVTTKVDCPSVEPANSDSLIMSDTNSEEVAVDIPIDSASIPPVEYTVIDPFDSADCLSHIVFYPVNDIPSESVALEAASPAPSISLDKTTLLDASVIIIAVLSLVYNFFDLLIQYVLSLLTR